MTTENKTKQKRCFPKMRDLNRRGFLCIFLEFYSKIQIQLLSNVKTTYVTSTTICPHQWDENNKVV